MAPFGASRAGLMSTRVDAIPDSVLDQKADFRFAIVEGEGTEIEDSIGDNDATANFERWDDSEDWVGGWAKDGDGVDDHIDVGTLGDFGSNLDNDWFLAFTIKTTDESNFIGFREDWDFVFSTDSFGFGAADDVVTFAINDEDGNNSQVETNTEVTDGNPHRLILNSIGPNPDDWEFYIDGSDDINVLENDSVSNVSNFPVAVYLLATNLDDNADMIIDNVIGGQNKITSEEATEDYNEQPWS